ncbi:hypothetical protein LCY76_22820 [Fictibacillus sp. KIGAM418]|uniref:Uncharacterized protein n=1 Tax=Fictibacillus marinisediminis TaxID=2878389 RepID=A0A9X1XKW4_9BACL|nr:hypothetical protein [Fictibacillus marinisediminis]MCK6259409.1 hypothetical protein [Fictibacillus marinisediminis]
MNTTLAKWMTAIIAITIITTPILMYLEAMEREIVDVTLNEATKKAAIDGYFTTETLDSITDNLVKRHKWSPDDIQMEATTVPQPRNEYIEITLSVPRGPLFLFEGLFDNGPKKITKNVRVMSEAIN